MSRSLWLDPSFGASGDMVLGALSAVDDDPAAIDELSSALGSLGVGDWSIERSDVIRGGITANRITVSAPPGPARHWSEIDATLATASLPSGVSDGARRTFRLLGDVEAAQHGIDIDEVHFHEVGAVDAIIDIVGAWWLLDRLAVDRVVVGPVGVGHGTVNAAHGSLPIPAPATLDLLRGAPVRALDAAFETCTPTGAALLRSMGSWGAIPAGTVTGAGRGAGRLDPAGHPNVLTAIVVESDQWAAGTEAAVVLATNVDDVTAEVLGRALEVLLSSGADDAWITPITMKKGRPAHQVCALVSPRHEATVRAAMSAETGTLGIRATAVDKFVAPRRVETIEVRGTPVRVKVGPHGAKPEHDDLVAIAVRDGVPVRVLSNEVLAIWASRT